MRRRLAALLTVVFVLSLVWQAILPAMVTTVGADEQSGGWMMSGNPEVAYDEVPATYTPPYSDAYNTDCDTREFNVVVREAKPFPSRQTEIRHTSNCAVMTARGMMDGEYLAAGVPAGKFTGTNELMYPVPNSSALMSFKTLDNSISLRVTFYDAIMPQESASTGEISYVLHGAKILKYPGDNSLTIRPGSHAFSRNGDWMVAEANSVGFVRINTKTKEVVPFAPPISPRTSTGPNKYIAVTEDGRYVALSLGDGRFKIYDLSSCTAPPQTPLIVSPCGEKNIETHMRNTFPGYVTSYYLRFASNEMLTFVTPIRDANNVLKKFRVRITPNGQVIQDVNYLALGDSFSSGEGAHDYENGTDTAENKCHLSKKSYPYVAADKMGIGDFRSVACSGAKSNAYFSEPQYEDIPSSAFSRAWLPGSAEQREMLKKANPNVVTISMIGNDVGFSNKLTKCILGTDSCFHFREERQSVAAEVAGKFDTLVSMYKSIQETAANDDLKVYVLGYPQLFSTDTQCAVNARLDQEERAFSRGLVTYLNAVIHAATERAGVQYIDVEDAFAGAQLCQQGKKAVNGLTAGNDALKVIGNESFHPNAKGHQLFAEALAAQSINFTKPMPAPNISKTAPTEGSDAYTALLGDAPWGSTFKRLKYTTLEGADVLISGGTAVLRSGEVFMPQSDIKVTFYSEPVSAGTIRSDAQGVASGEITVPAELPPGFHTIHLDGKDLANKDITLYRTIYVAASQLDYDGDGVPNTEEACLAVEPAGQDVDRDGTDDACDGEIGDPPADTLPPIVLGLTERQPNEFGWYNAPVLIDWSAEDPEPSSGGVSSPEPVRAEREGLHEYSSEAVCDVAGNCSTGSLALALDTSIPEIKGVSWAQNPTVGSTGVRLDAHDAVSWISAAEYFTGTNDPGFGKGVAMTVNRDAGTVSADVSAEPGIHQVTFRIRDAAGNWSADRVEELVVTNPQSPRIVGLVAGIHTTASNLPTTEYLQVSVSENSMRARYEQQAGIMCRFFYSPKCLHILVDISDLDWAVQTGDKAATIQGKGTFKKNGTHQQARVRMQVTESGNAKSAKGSTYSMKVYTLTDGSLLHEVSQRTGLGNILIK